MVSHWNYRVLQKTIHFTEGNEITFNDADGNEITDGETEFVIVEMFYDDDGETLVGYTSAHPAAETADELRQTLELMLKALDKPVIDESDL